MQIYMIPMALLKKKKKKSKQDHWNMNNVLIYNVNDFINITY